MPDFGQNYVQRATKLTESGKPPRTADRAVKFLNSPQTRSNVLEGGHGQRLAVTDKVNLLSHYELVEMVLTATADPGQTVLQLLTKAEKLVQAFNVTLPVWTTER